MPCCACWNLGVSIINEGVVHKESYTLYYVTDRHRMQEMYNEIMRTMPNAFHCLPDRFKTQKMGKKAVKKYPCALQYAPINIITQKMCYEAARIEPLSLAYVPGWFVTQQQIGVWYDDDYAYSDNEMIKWYDGY